MKVRDNYVLLLLLVCSAIFLINLDAIFVNIMEARNFITAREMINFDHWIFTTMNNEARYEKPPLPTWMTAISMLILGMKSLFALRLPAAIMGILSVFAVFKITEKLTANSRLSFTTGLVAATSFYILLSGRDGQWDIFTHSFMLWAVYCLIGFFRKEKVWRNALIAGLLIGCSFLSKGPVSFYALLLPFLIAYWIVYRSKFSKASLFPFISMLLIATVVAASWSLYVYFFDYSDVTEITNREAGRWLDYNVRPFYYYWNFFIQSGLWTVLALVSLIYPYLKNRVQNTEVYRFSWLWTILAVILLSLIPEKKPRYLLPVLFPLAITTGLYLEYVFANFKKMHIKESWVLFFNYSLIALVGIAFPIAGTIYFGAKMANIWPWFLLLSLCLVTIAVLMIYFLRKKEIRQVFYLSIWFIISVLTFGLPMAQKIEVNPDFRSSETLSLYEADLGLKAYEFKNFTPELIWEYGKPVPRLWDGKDFQLPEANKFLLLATEEETSEMKSVFSSYRIEKLDYIDMNPVGNKHKDRLFRNIYLIQKPTK